MKVHFEIQGDSTLLSFTVPRTSQLTLSNILRSFPIPGTWHFRAKAECFDFGEERFVWQDLPDDSDDIVPKYHGKIHLKAIPLSKLAFDQYEETDDLILVQEHEPVPDAGEAIRRLTEANTPMAATATSASLSLLGKAFASSAKAAMDAVRKNVS